MSEPWNKGVEVGQRRALTPREVVKLKRVITKCDNPYLRARNLAMFSVAIDTMLHVSDLLALSVGDVRHGSGAVKEEVAVTTISTGVSVSCVLSARTQGYLRAWLDCAGKSQSEPLFTGFRRFGKALTPRQLTRLVKTWVEDIGLDPTDYGTESLRRTRALHIARKTGDLETVRRLLGHKRMASTVAYLREEFAEVRVDPLSASRQYMI